jgi:hypothetical protein
MAKGTCRLGDGNPVKALDLCEMHYGRLRANGDPLVTKLIRGDDEARWWSHVDRRSDDECWPWTAGLDTKGYGVFTMRSKSVKAYRWGYERFVEPVPPGMELDHVKDNGCTRHDCVNFLRHLEPVTSAVNTLRGDGPSAQNARKTHCDSGHEFTSENTRITVKPNGRTRRSCRQCARDTALAHYHRKRARSAA